MADPRWRLQIYPFLLPHCSWRKLQLAIYLLKIPSRDLKDKGFVFEVFDDLESEGSFTALFAFESATGPSGFKIVEIVEEEKYLQKHPTKKLEVHLEDEPRPLKYLDHKNSCHEFLGVLKPKELPEGELRTYLAIRKPGEIAAVRLSCRDWQQFLNIAKPERIFETAQGPLGLIHLGTTSFDILVSPGPK